VDFLDFCFAIRVDREDIVEVFHQEREQRSQDLLLHFLESTVDLGFRQRILDGREFYVHHSLGQVLRFLLVVRRQDDRTDDDARYIFMGRFGAAGQTG